MILRCQRISNTACTPCDAEPRVVVIAYGRTAFVDDEDEAARRISRTISNCRTTPQRTVRAPCRELRANNAQSGSDPTGYPAPYGHRTYLPRRRHGTDVRAGTLRRLPAPARSAALPSHGASSRPPNFSIADQLRAFLNPQARETRLRGLGRPTGTTCSPCCEHHCHCAKPRGDALHPAQRVVVPPIVVAGGISRRFRVAACFGDDRNATGTAHRAVRVFGVRNLGNEATLAAVSAAFANAFAGCRLMLVSSPPRARPALPTYPTILPHDLRRCRAAPGPGAFAAAIGLVRMALHWITEPLRLPAHAPCRRHAASTCCMVPGTGIADDFGIGPLDVPHHIARWCRAVRRLGGYVCFPEYWRRPGQLIRCRAGGLPAAPAVPEYRSYRE